MEVEIEYDEDEINALFDEEEDDIDLEGELFASLREDIDLDGMDLETASASISGGDATATPKKSTVTSSTLSSRSEDGKSSSSSSIDKDPAASSSPSAGLEAMVSKVQLKAELRDVHVESPTNSSSKGEALRNNSARGTSSKGRGEVASVTVAPEVLLTKWFMKIKGKYKDGLNKKGFWRLQVALGNFLCGELWRVLHWGLAKSQELGEAERKAIDAARRELRAMAPRLGMSFAEATFTVTYKTHKLGRIVKQKRNFVVVRAVEPGSPAAEAGIRVDDILLKVGNTKFTKPNDYFLGTSGCVPGDEVEFKIQRQLDSFSVMVTLGAEGASAERVAELRALVAKEDQDVIPWESFFRWMQCLVEKQDKLPLLFRMFDRRNRGAVSRADFFSVLDEGYHDDFIVLAGNNEHKMRVSAVRLATMMGKAAGKQNARRAQGKHHSKAAKAEREEEQRILQDMRERRSAEEDKIKAMVDEVFAGCALNADGRVVEQAFCDWANKEPPMFLIWWLGALNFRGAAAREAMHRMLRNK